MTELEYNKRVQELNDAWYSESDSVCNEYDKKHDELDKQLSEELDKLEEKHTKALNLLYSKYNKEKEAEEKVKADRQKEIDEAFENYKKLALKFNEDYCCDNNYCHDDDSFNKSLSEFLNSILY
jgi:hypothetical protein